MEGKGQGIRGRAGHVCKEPVLWKEPENPALGLGPRTQETLSVDNLEHL